MNNITYIPALLRIFIEILSNAIDNIYRSQEDEIPMSKIKISLSPEGESSIWNDGTWIPHDKFEDSTIAIPQLIFGELLTSDNYDDTIDRYGSGRNGYGAKLTNIFSLVSMCTTGNTGTPNTVSTGAVSSKVSTSSPSLAGGKFSSSSSTTISFCNL